MRGVVAVAAAALALVAVAVVPTAEAQGSGQTATVEVRVWQDVGNELDIQISARPATGLWQALGTIPLPLDDGLSSTGRYRYGDIALDVPLANRASPAPVEVRVWQDVDDSARIYISARPADGDWRILGTIRLLLDDGFSSSGTYRFGDISLDVPLPQEAVSTLAGAVGVWGYADGVGSEARFGRQGESSIGDLWLDVAPDGSVIVADTANGAVRRVAPDGTVSTIAGGNRGRLWDPVAVAVDAEGSFYVAGRWDRLIRKFSADGRQSRVVAGGGPEDLLSVQPAVPADQAYFFSIKGLATGPEGDLYIIEQERIRRLSPSGWVTTLAGGSGLGYVDGPGAEAKFHWLEAIAVDDAGNVYVIDRVFVLSEGTFTTIRKVDTSGVVSTLYRGEPPFSGGILAGPTGLALTPDGEILISNTGRNQILRLTAEGSLEAVAGSGEDGYVDGPRGAAALSLPGSIAVRPDGSLVVADQAESLLRVIASEGGGFDSAGITLANPGPVLPKEGARATLFARDLPFRPGVMALDASNRVVVADEGFGAVRRISPDGTVTTIAGANGTGSRDGPGDVAQFKWPRGMAAHPDGALYVADYGNERIRKVSPDGSVTTVDLPAGFQVQRPQAVAFDGEGNLLIAESFPGRLYRVSADGEVSTLIEGLQFIHAMTVGDDGDIYLTARRYGRAVILKVTADGRVSTVVQSLGEDYGGLFTLDIEGIAVAPDGTLYVADTRYGRVVEIAPDGAIAIVIEHDVYSPYRNEQGPAVLLMPDGSLLVSTINAIWRVSFEGEGE